MTATLHPPAPAGGDAPAPAGPPDAGLFGPASVTWRVHADPAMALAGLRALLLQAVHPLAMAGVDQRSSFRADPWGRLFRTAEYVATITYGTTAEAERAGARVRGLHRRAGEVTEPESGDAARVDAPDLLRWVHCCEVDSFLTTYRRCGGRLTDDEADAYVAEQAEAARLVGLDPEEVPQSVAELAAYFAAVRPSLRVTRAARQAARFVLVPPMPTAVRLATPAQPAWALVAGVAFAMLPGWARRLYRLPPLPVTDLAATAYGRALRRGLVALPPQLREGPHVRAARERLSLAGPLG